MNKDFELGLKKLAESIYQDIFVAFDLPMSSGDWDFPGIGSLYGCFWICPEAPPLDYSFWGKQLRYPLVESVRPTLTWSSFPNERQAKQFYNATGRRIDNVRYDLKIWRSQGDNIFQVNNIPENYYTPEVDLEAQTDYFWSIRACFDFDEKSVCTPWAKSTIPATSSVHVGNGAQPVSDLHHFRFRTP